MKLSEYDINQTYAATVLDSVRITDRNTVEVRHIALRIQEPTFHYLEGQSIAVLVPGPHVFGNPLHVRLYSIASPRQIGDPQSIEFSICVRRCSYIDEVSGERYPGVASNYLCDLAPGDKIQIAGPYGRAFLAPQDISSNLLMIGVGTGIAPFRAFIKRIYDQHKEWKGKARLFYGARTGMDMLYMNDENSDLSNYYDKESFQAFECLSPRPHSDEPEDLERTLLDNAKEVWALAQDPKTYVYVSGLARLEETLDKAFAEVAGSDETWRAQKDQLVSSGRWATLFYD